VIATVAKLIPEDYFQDVGIVKSKNMHVKKILKIVHIVPDISVTDLLLFLFWNQMRKSISMLLKAQTLEK
jgi:hypothetical protein